MSFLDMEKEEIEIEDNHDFEYMLSNTNEDQEIDIKIEKKEKKNLDSFIICNQKNDQKRKISDYGTQTEQKKSINQDLLEMSFINKHPDMSRISDM